MEIDHEKEKKRIENELMSLKEELDKNNKLNQTQTIEMEDIEENLLNKYDPKNLSYDELYSPSSYINYAFQVLDNLLIIVNKYDLISFDYDIIQYRKENKCPTPGCKGLGNTSSSKTGKGHTSIKYCPIAQEQNRNRRASEKEHDKNESNAKTCVDTLAKELMRNENRKIFEQSEKRLNQNDDQEVIQVVSDDEIVVEPKYDEQLKKKNKQLEEQLNSLNQEVISN